MPDKRPLPDSMECVMKSDTEALRFRREGENRDSKEEECPYIKLVNRWAATMEVVMPHFWKPVATYQCGLLAENLPI